MKSILSQIIFLASFAFAWPLQAVTYYTALDGDDVNPGTESSPWRTIQQAANTVLPGDTVIVRAGTYDERITTVRGGTSEASRITFQAEGQVNMRGWIINHGYITVKGFDITGHSSPISTTSFVKLNSGGDFFELLYCTIRDGFAIKREDMVFIAPNQISTATGGFVAAGFFPGQSIALRRGTNVSLASPQSSNYTISSVNDTTLTVTESTVVDDGPKPAYISGSPNFGLHFHGSTQNAVFRGNVFTNLSYIMMLVLGSNHLFEANTFVQNNGWDIMVLGGTDHVFRRNTFRNFGWGVYSPSPDVIDNFGSTRFARVLFTNNFIQNVIGVISVQKALPTVVSGPLVLSHNVFVDIGLFSGSFPHTTIEHNTFLRVARHSNPAVSVTRHPLVFNTSNYATNATIRNNIFVDCGEATGNIPWSEVGWYRIDGPTNSVTTEGNFVAGPAPDYPAKTTWPEGNPLLNGGDPGFVNINDPLGPDGVPFTDDDGLRLRSDSKLRSAGGGGRGIGAYAYFPSVPTLTMVALSNNQVRLSWPALVEEFELEAAPDASGIWTDPGLTPVLQGDLRVVIVDATNSMHFYRLASDAIRQE